MTSLSAPATTDGLEPLPSRRTRSRRRHRGRGPAQVAAGRRGRPRRRGRGWLRVVAATGACTLVAVAVLGGVRYTRARGDARAAAAQWRAGHYAAAAASLAAARGAWPWLTAARQEPEALALARSSLAFQRGLADMGAGAYASAQVELTRVLPADKHYALAQSRLTTLRAAFAAAGRAQVAGDAANRFAADAQAFWGAYRVALANLVPAWEQYGFGNPAPYEHAASVPVAGMPALAGRLAHDAGAIAAIAACPSGSGAPQAASALSKAGQAARAAATSALGIARLGGASLSTLENGSALTVSEEVPAEISAINADATDLQTEQGGVATWMARGRGALGTEVRALLGPGALVSLLQTGGTPAAGASPDSGGVGTVTGTSGEPGASAAPCG